MKKPPPISFAQWLTWGKSKANTHIKIENNQIETPKHRFDLVAIPGHAVDMMCLHEANEGWLFSADLFVSEYIKYFMRNESMKEQIASIKKVLKLDFEVLLCSHNPQFADGKQKLRNKLHFLEDYYEKVANLYHRGHAVSSIFKEMKLKNSWGIRFISGGSLSPINMIESVIRDESNQS